MSCPCQKEIKDIENLANLDGNNLPEPTIGVKFLSGFYNVLAYIICIAIALFLFPFAFTYILLSGIFHLNVSLSTAKLVKFIKFFG